MNWLNPYLVPLLVLFVMYRRIGRRRKVSVDRLPRLTMIVCAATAWAVWASGMPSSSWLMAYALAAMAGAVAGYLRSTYTELSVNPDNGQVESRQTPIATAILMGLFAGKFGIATLFPESNGGKPPSARSLVLPQTVEAVQTAQHASHTAATINYATDTLLIFSAFMFAAAAVETWQRATRLMTTTDDRRVERR